MSFLDRLPRLAPLAPFLLLAGCASSGSGPMLEVSDNQPLEIVSAGLLVDRGGNPELGLTLINRGSLPLWLNVHFQTPDGRQDCFQGRELEPAASHVFLCPQPRLRPDTDYPLRVTAYAMPDSVRQLSEITAVLRFGSDDILAIGG